MYEYRATLRRVIDGDTIEVTLDHGCRLLSNQTIRFRGVNAPERKTPTRAAGDAARAWMIERLPRSEWSLTIKTHLAKHEEDAFRRLLGDVFVDGSLINQELIEQGHGVPFMTDA